MCEGGNEKQCKAKNMTIATKRDISIAMAMFVAFTFPCDSNCGIGVCVSMYVCCVRFEDNIRPLNYTGTCNYFCNYQFAVCESSNIPVELPIDMYGVLQYQAHQICLSLAHVGLLVSTFGMIFSKVAVFLLLKVTLP